MVISEILLKVAQHLQTTSESAFSKKGLGLQKFSDFLRIVFTSKGNSNDIKQTDASYKVIKNAIHELFTLFNEYCVCLICSKLLII